jgi:peptide/nickel transport system ATP-binding protein
MAILLITHNLGLVRGIADRVLVMYAGQIVESGGTEEILERPAHPYTRALIASVPELGKRKDRLTTIAGGVPRAGLWPGGCRFESRCDWAEVGCGEAVPALAEIGGEFSHKVRCPLWKKGA